MSEIFPKWTNQLPLKVAVGVLLTGSLATAGIWYYCTPKYARVGYSPVQPVPFSHAAHVEQMGMDCRYCHNAVDRSWYSNIPSSSTCMNCHTQVLATDPRLELVRESAKLGKSIPWVQIHRTPDFVYYNHAVHVNRGVSCVLCHGRIDLAVEVKHEKPFSMLFCLDCHRNPAPNLRPPEQVYNLGWTNDTRLQQAAGDKFVKDWKVQPSQYCSTCHR
jgi:hypothetical protein